VASRLLLIAACAAVVLGLAAPPASARYHEFDCVMRDGPARTWTVPEGTDVWTGRTYEIRGFGTSCAMAKRWVRHLAADPYRGANKPLRHGPPGWRCLSGRISSVFHPKTAWIGNCQNRRDTRRVFDWSEHSGTDDHPVTPPQPAPAPDPEPTPPY
jgi:hypothetical protein